MENLANKVQDPLPAFAALFTNNPAPMLISRNDKFIEVNAAFLDKLGYARDEIIGQSVLDSAIFVDVANYLQAMQELEATGRIQDKELRVKCNNGKLLHGMFFGNIIDYQREKCYLTVMIDITDIRQELEKNAELLLKERTLLGAALYSIQEGIITTDQAGKITVMNQTAEELTGWSQAEARGEDFDRIFSVYYDVTREKAVNPVRYVLETEQSSFSLADVVLIAKNGVERHIVGIGAPAITRDGTVIGAAVNFHDITAFWQKQKQDEYLIQHDLLTGTYNRRFFDQKIAEETERSDRYNQPLSMMILDLDHFKKVNDSWGHPVGDEVLKKTAETVSGLIRKIDFLVRLGGEEFVVLMPQTSGSGALLAAEKIRAALDRDLHPVAGKVTTSIGVAERMKEESFNSWYTRVDEALYRAKDFGRNRVVIAENQERSLFATIQLKWEPEWESGQPGIDAQHRELVKIGNKLISLSLAGAETDEVLHQLEQLIDHIALHFAYEEQILVQIEYPDRMRHGNIHKGLVKKALKLKETYLKGKLKPAAFFSFMFDDLLVGHMLREDKKFFSFIRPTVQIV